MKDGEDTKPQVGRQSLAESVLGTQLIKIRLTGKPLISTCGPLPLTLQNIVTASPAARAVARTGLKSS